MQFENPTLLKGGESNWVVKYNESPNCFMSEQASEHPKKKPLFHYTSVYFKAKWYRCYAA